MRTATLFTDRKTQTEIFNRTKELHLRHNDLSGIFSIMEVPPEFKTCVSLALLKFMRKNTHFKCIDGRAFSNSSQLYAYYQGGEDGPLSSSCHYVLGTLELNLSYDREDQSIGLLIM